MEKSKVLLFKDIFEYKEKYAGKTYSLATFYLSSMLKKNNINVIVFQDKMISQEARPLFNKEKLINVLKQNPDVNIIGISLYEAFFSQTKQLIDFLQSETKAFIGVGGIMPTLTPKHVIKHLKNINFLIRGEAEIVFPRFASILSGRMRDDILKQGQKKELLELKGFFFRNSDDQFFSSIDIINKVGQENPFYLDFSFLRKDDLFDGLFLFTSRGCYNNCFFCSTPGRGSFIARNEKSIELIFDRYKTFTKKISSKQSQDINKVSFYDDDFLADPQRANRFFNILMKKGLKINFFQTGINSFFKREGQKYIKSLNKNLLNKLNPDLFFGNKRYVYIGTENFSDKELYRLGKGYTYEKIKKVVHALSEKRIYQHHHLILSNQMTTLEDLFDNLYKISLLQKRYKDFFRVLTPIIPHLVSLFPTKSYEIIQKKGQQKFLKVNKWLCQKRSPEYDYPMVEHDIPIDKEVQEFVPFIADGFLKEQRYHKILEQCLYRLALKNNTSADNKRILNRYKNVCWVFNKKI